VDYLTVVIQMTLSHLQGHSPTVRPFSSVITRTVVQQFTTLQLT